MTHSATNTAARELLPCPFCGGPPEVTRGNGPLTEIRCINHDCSIWPGIELPEQHAVIAWNERATLTQQQGGEQEADVERQARELLAAEYERDGLGKIGEYIRNPDPSIKFPIESCAIRAITAALRTKQPAASEGDGRAMLRECYEWLFESKADGPQVSEGAIERGYYTPEFRDLHDRLRAAIDNTSKQAAGEAVAWNVYQHGSSSVTSDIVMAQHWRDEGCRVVPLVEATTPPRHPADEGRDAWKKDAPKESGWYWHDDRDSMRLHYVFTRPGHSYLCTEGEPYGPGQKRNFQAVQKMGGVWSGPVNPPTRAALQAGTP